MMNYTEMLNKIISESGMSQKEICDKCEEYGEKVTTSYLSGLKTNQGKMAGEEISRAIAKACNTKYSEILVVQAYLDKCPQYLMEFLEDSRTVYREAAKLHKRSLSEIYETPENLNEVNNEIKRLEEDRPLAEYICEQKEEKLPGMIDTYKMYKTNNTNDNELEISESLKEKLIEGGNWLLIPLSDMNNSQIVTQKDAAYIKEILDRKK